MTPEELAQAIRALGMKPAAAARYLGMSARQMRRHLRGERAIGVPAILLLNCLIAHRLKPLVPKPKPRSY
jgi:DNA-binding transcriptional regulator YiaG